MREPQRVTDLVRGQLTDPLHHHGRCFRLLGLCFGRRGLSVAVRRKQRFSDQKILPVAQGAQRHHPFQDLARARIDHACPVAPPARGPVHPVDHVVANVLGVGPGGQLPDLKCVAESGGLEGRIPPARALDQGTFNRFGRASVHVVDDRVDRVTQLGVWIALYEPVSRDQANVHRCSKGGGIVAIAKVEIARARIKRARPVARCRQRDQGKVLHHCHVPRVGRDGCDELRGAVVFPGIGKGEQRLDLRVARKGF